jgi:D-amino-acid dehydrogenase
MLFPGDESGDCQRFTEELAAHAQLQGVKFLASTSVTQLVADGARIARIATNRGDLTADAYVLACGSYSPLLLRPLGIRLPVYPVKGYSITVPITHDAAAPQGTLTDETYKVVLTRLGNRLRAAGTAELCGYDLTLRPARLATLKHVVHDLFPASGDLTHAEPWAGLRPMTPDNPPVLGETNYKNLYLNTGHGTLGWTMACGSGQLLADLISGRAPQIDLEGLTLARFT